jgi:hypothetical protein
MYDFNDEYLKLSISKNYKNLIFTFIDFLKNMVKARHINRIFNQMSSRKMKRKVL